MATAVLGVIAALLVVLVHGLWWAKASESAGMAWTWSAAASPGFTMGMMNTQAVYDAARQQVVVYHQGQTWTFDGQSWVRHNVAGPTSWMDAGMVYDQDHNNVLFFGGRKLTGSNADTNETWVWDGTTWQQRSPTTRPSAREPDGQLVWDQTRHQILLYGGRVTSGGFTQQILGDTWVWDGTTWSATSPSVSPPPAWGGGLGFDPTDGTVKFWGGSAATTSAGSWSWQGNTWSELPASADVPSDEYSMESLAAGGLSTPLVQVFPENDGNLTNPYTDQTYVWTGDAWTREPTAGSPDDSNLGPRALALVVGDAQHDRFFMLGGVASQGNDTVDWAKQALNPTSPSLTSDVSVLQLQPVAGICSGYLPNNTSDYNACIQTYVQYAAKPAQPLQLQPTASGTDSDGAPVAASADVGDASSIAAVETAVVSDLTANDLAQVMPVDVSARIQSASDTAGAAARRQELAQAWAPDVLANHVAEVETAYQYTAEDANSPSLLDARFTVRAWQGVQISGATATATLLASEGLRFSDAPTTWLDDSPEQYVVHLTSSGGAWLMEKFNATSVEG